MHEPAIDSHNFKSIMSMKTVQKISTANPISLPPAKLFYFVYHLRIRFPLSDFLKRPQKGQKARFLGVTFRTGLLLRQVGGVNTQSYSYLSQIVWLYKPQERTCEWLHLPLKKPFFAIFNKSETACQAHELNAGNQYNQISAINGQTFFTSCVIIPHRSSLSGILKPP
jgi:hypothetical protein